MQILTLVGLLAFVASSSGGGALLPAATVIRAPKYDSAIIKTSGVGGNFAYSTLQGLAYQPNYTPLVTKNYYPYQYQYQWNPFHFGSFPPQTQLIFGQPIYYPFAPVSPIGIGGFNPVQVPAQPGYPGHPSGGSQGTLIDEDTVAVDSA